MTETHEPAHEGPSFKAYIVVFVALSVFTALSFLVNWTLGQNQTSMMIILCIAVIKAVLVALIFMHLKFDWSKLYFIVIPVMILTVMLIIVLLPDFVLGWRE